MNRLANNGIPAAPSGGFTLPGFLGQTPLQSPQNQLERVISTAIGVMTIIAFIWFVIQFFLAAIAIIGSGGDKAALATAKSKLTTSVVGLVVVISAIFLIELIGGIFGINILYLQSLIINLSP
jgi:hypothetical protein